jgi:RimJ/RimL family protein N-acetyltransferase
MISIRPVEPTDVDIFYEHQADPVAADMAKFPSRDRATYTEHFERSSANATAIRRAVLVDDVVAGNMMSWRSEDGRRLVGYWLDREFWGRGVATEALRLFVTEIKERPLFAYVASTNLGSARVLEKAGFVASEETEIADDNIEERLFVLN